MSTADFLLELRSEEIPARMQYEARIHLQTDLETALRDVGIEVVLGKTTVWSTPRRLSIIIFDLPLSTVATREEIKGPKTSAPTQALEGFLRKTGLRQEQLVERDGVWFAVIEKPGRSTADLLAEAIPSSVRGFRWPKSMRWGTESLSPESLRWVRPLSGVVALLGDSVVDFEIDGIRSGRTTIGHRFHAPSEIEIGSAQSYQQQLKAAMVIVDHSERQNIVRDGAHSAANSAGLTLVDDGKLVIENAGLTEWPVPLLGRFDEAFLEVPPEVIQLTARVNQKYFICRDSAGQLANAFVCTANIAASDGGAVIVAGNRKVLAARLSDARFFWEQDRKTPLSVHAKKLGRITFHEKLGTVAGKVERVAKLAEWLATEGVVPGCDPELARQAAELCKADLVTEMVGEFPELQGLMGGYYARAEGLADAVADAIRDHYKPVGQGDEVPTAPVTIAVALADKLDTLVGFFLIDERPTGSKDPYALRRAMLGLINLILSNNLRFNLSGPVQTAMALNIVGLAAREFIPLNDAYLSLKSSDYAEIVRNIFVGLGLKNQQARQAELINGALETAAHLDRFLSDRLKVQQKEAGVRHDLIDAVFALGGEDDLVRLLARVHALQAFVGTEDGTNLLAGYKRAANILKKEDWQGIEAQISQTGEEDPLANVDDPELTPAIAAKMADRHGALSYSPEPEEKALIDALDSAGPRATEALAGEDFAGAMAALATLRGPIDAFFDKVTVNDADPAKRGARLQLLDQFRAAVHKVADFSRIEG